MKKILITCIILLLNSGYLNAAEPAASPSPGLSKAATLEFVLMDGNNIYNWIGNNGQLTSHVPTGDAGAEWPNGSDISAVFATGFSVLGQIEGELRSAYIDYTSEWTPGSIPYDTQSQLPLSDSPTNTVLEQIYHIERGNSANPNSPTYNPEYAIWPASDGAPAHDGEYFSDFDGDGSWSGGEPFEDFNLDNTYNPPDGQLVTGEDPPVFRASQMAWYVMNDWDPAGHARLWGTDPLGIEAQVLVYNIDSDPIYENVQFYQITLVNKGGVSIDSSFFGLWSDVDLGAANDDQGGCDSSLSLTYIYNGTAYDYEYGTAPPAVGYKILQGPMIVSPSDTLEYDGTSFPGKSALGMTASLTIRKGAPSLSDPEIPEEAYQHLQGRDENGEIFIDPWGIQTPFHLPGDPVNGTGWIAEGYMTPDDRRFNMGSGPFDLPPWEDTNENGQADFGEPGVQVIDLALIIVAGADHLDAITNLKYVSSFTQFQYDHASLLSEIAPPQFSASANNAEIILNWYEGATAYESLDSPIYNFEGYNIFQGYTADGPWTKLATYDIANGIGTIMDQHFDEHGLLLTGPVHFGTDDGLGYLHSVESDILMDDKPLVNNKLYHFAMEAYAYAAEAYPKTITSNKRVVSIRPHLNHDNVDPNQMLVINGPEYDGASITVEVSDPSKLTDQDYEIGFQYDSSQSKGRWHMLRYAAHDKDTLVRSDWFTGTYNHYISSYMDGFELSVDEVSFDPPRINTFWEQTVNVEGTQFESLTLEAVSPGGVDSLAWTNASQTEMVHMDTLYGINYGYDYFTFDDLTGFFTLYSHISNDVRIQGFGSTFGGINGDMLADIPNIGGGTQNSEYLQGDLEIRFTESGQLATCYTRRRTDTLLYVPFEVWDIERDVQLCLGIKDNNSTGSIQDTSLENWQNSLDSDWVIVFYQDYASFAGSLQALRDNPHSGWCWNFNDESKFSVGDIVHLSFLNPISEGDIYSWTTNAGPSTYDEDALDLINVFPNPFLGYQSEQASYYQPYVTISNLPNEQCTVRVYSLGGQLVRRFEHQSGNYENWDLLNTHGSLVASGMYLIHVEVEGLGNKLLKLAVFQPEW